MNPSGRVERRSRLILAARKEQHRTNALPLRYRHHPARDRIHGQRR